MQEKVQKMVSNLEIISFGCVKHSLLEREYLSSSVNMLTNSVKNIDTTKKEIFELVFFQSYQKI